MKPTLSIGLPNFGHWMPAGSGHRFIELGKMADDAGIDRIVLVDHVVMGANTQEYRWGRFPTTPDAPWYEPLTLLAGIAAATSHVRLATSVVLPSLRGAVVFAKTTATLDVISQGRLELGVGIGWQREEYDAAGIEWDNRSRIFTDTLGACIELWNNLPASYHSPTINFDEIYLVPQPAQPGGVPILIAGTLTPTNLNRLARLGNGWIPIMGESLDGVRSGVQMITQAMKEHGRDTTGLIVQGSIPLSKNSDDTWDLAATMQNGPALIDAGATGADTSSTGAIDKKQLIRKIDNVNDVKSGETAYIIDKTADNNVVIKDSTGENVTETTDDETKNTIFDFINPPASMGQAGGRRRSRRNRRQNGKRQSKKRQQNRQSKKQKQNGGKKRRNSKRNQKK